MACDTVGKADCFVCGAESPVRVNKNKKLFIMCASCGMIYPNTREGQEKLKGRMRALDAAPQPAPEPKKENAPAPAPEPKKEAPPAPEVKKKFSILDMVP